MKKLLLSVFLLLFVGTITQAQNPRKYQFGIKVGMGVSSASTANDNITAQQAEAAVVGFFGKYNIGKFSIQSEVYFLRSGVIFREPQYDVRNIIWFNSYNIPVLAGYRFGNKSLSWHVATGPAISFITKHDQSFYAHSGPAFYIPNIKFGSRAYYWQAGAGIDYKRLLLDVGYSAGLNNVSTSGYNQKLNNLVASLGFRIF